MCAEEQLVARIRETLTLNASRISSSESVSFILRAMRVKNSGKSMVPLPSASTWSAQRDEPVRSARAG